MLRVYNFTNPKTKRLESVMSVEGAHDVLDDLLMDTDQLEAMTGKKIDWNKTLSLFEEIEAGKYGQELKKLFRINCEASVLLAMATKHFREDQQSNEIRS